MSLLSEMPIQLDVVDRQTGKIAEIWRRYFRKAATLITVSAPVGAQYLVATHDPDLPAERNLGALATGYLKLTTVAGVATPSTVTTVPTADLTGTIPDARFPATLPAISGVNLTALTLANVTGLVAALAAKAPLVPRVTGAASSATPTPDADATDLYSLTAQAAAAAFGNPTGTPVNGQRLTIRIKDNGTARALTWGPAYVAGGVALPTTTVLSKILTLGWIYNTDNALNKWQLIASAQEA